MIVESYAKRCNECGGKGYISYKLCLCCGGNGQVIVVDEGHTLRAAVSEFLADVRSKYLGAVRAK